MNEVNKIKIVSFICTFIGLTIMALIDWRIALGVTIFVLGISTKVIIELEKE